MPSILRKDAADAVPPQFWFAVSAVFHYLGPSFAVLLFPRVGVLGVVWLRIATAALVFLPIARPWRVLRRSTNRERLLLLALGLCLAAMNCAFYLALERMPLGTVAAIEFAGTIGVAVAGLRSRRNLQALSLAIAGIVLLTDMAWRTDPLGLFWALLNGALFVAYIVLGHRISRSAGGDGIQRLGAAMAIAFVAVFPVGLDQALVAFSRPELLLAAIGIGLCSSVLPYICDQLAMARLPRASFALLLTALPACATILGAIVLAQIPSFPDVLGTALVMAGIALHRPSDAEPTALETTACNT